MFSFIICTYNPDEETLKRVVAALQNQDFPKQDYEIIVIDNNSHTPVNEFSFIKNNSSLVCKIEPRQGLAFARITGIKTAKVNHLVFIDDDNVIDKNYLRTLKDLWDTHPQVGVWGPGNITLDYKDGAPGWIKKNYGPLFQQKSTVLLQYGCVVGWPNYYPAGSGMAVTRQVLLSYIAQFEMGVLNATGRKGNSMASSEDSQIVWSAVKMGLAAGTSPLLKLTHVIPASRANRKYLSRLNFGIAQSYHQAFLEMFPELNHNFTKRTLINKLSFVLKTILKSKGNPIMFYRYFTIDNGWFAGISK